MSPRSMHVASSQKSNQRDNSSVLHKVINGGVSKAKKTTKGSEAGKLVFTLPHRGTTQATLQQPEEKAALNDSGCAAPGGNGQDAHDDLPDKMDVDKKDVERKANKGNARKGSSIFLSKSKTVKITQRWGMTPTNSVFPKGEPTDSDIEEALAPSAPRNKAKAYKRQQTGSSSSTVKKCYSAKGGLKKF